MGKRRETLITSHMSCYLTMLSASVSTSMVGVVTAER